MMRRNAARMAKGFSADGLSDWIWRSVGDGQPSDPRFERLLPPDPAEFAYFVDGPVPQEVLLYFGPVYRALERLRSRGFQPAFVLDIGASTGVWSHAVSQLFPEARFLLVDPLLSNYDPESRRHYIGAHANFEVFELAVSNRPGRASLAVSKNLYGSSLMGLADGQGRTVEIEVTTLDHLFEESRVSGRGLLKVDVQHAEHLVLEGGQRALGHVDVVVLELTLAGVPAGGKSLLEMLNLMDDLGFRYVDDAGEWRSAIDGTLMEKDVVFARKELVV